MQNHIYLEANRRRTEKVHNIFIVIENFQKTCREFGEHFGRILGQFRSS